MIVSPFTNCDMRSVSGRGRYSDWGMVQESLRQADEKILPLSLLDGLFYPCQGWLRS